MARMVVRPLQHLTPLNQYHSLIALFKMRKNPIIPLRIHAFNSSEDLENFFPVGKKMSLIPKFILIFLLTTIAACRSDDALKVSDSAGSPPKDSEVIYEQVPKDGPRPTKAPTTDPTPTPNPEVNPTDPPHTKKEKNSDGSFTITEPKFKYNGNVKKIFNIRYTTGSATGVCVLFGFTTYVDYTMLPADGTDGILLSTAGQFSSYVAATTSDNHRIINTVTCRN